MLGIRAQFSGLLAAGCAVTLMCASLSVDAQDAAGKGDSPNPPGATTKAKAGSKTEAPSGSSSTHAKSNAAAEHNSKSKQTATSRRASRKRTARGQQKIDAQRAQEIEAALIREHYLTGQADGNWSAACEEAMRRYQADHGWQSKTVPDARALISLGLGPNHDHLLNPESAMTTEPAADATSQSAAPGAPTPARPLKAAPTPSSDPPSVATPAQNPSNPQ